MEDKDKLDINDTFVPYDHATSTTKLLKSLSALLERDTEDPEPSGATSATKTRVSWMQRVLSWFRRS